MRLAGKVAILAVCMVSGIFYAAYQPQNGPTPNPDAHLPPSMQTHYVAKTPHYENTPAMALAAAVPAIVVLLLVYKFIRGPRRNAGLFLLAFLVSLLASAWFGMSAHALEHGIKVPLVTFAETTLYETFGIWAPFYCAAGIGAMALVMAIIGMNVPASKRRSVEDFETFDTKW